MRLKEFRICLFDGEKEEQNKKFLIRKQGEGDKGSMKITTFAELLTEEVERMITQW